MQQQMGRYQPSHEKSLESKQGKKASPRCWWSHERHLHRIYQGVISVAVEEGPFAKSDLEDGESESADWVIV